MSIDHDSAQAQKLKDICTESGTGVPGLFEGAAAYYARYRPKYPMAMFDRLVDRFDLGTLSSVLDLGCGTGQLALPFSERQIPVYAVDPEIEMLQEGIRIARDSGIPGTRWMLGSDRTIDSLNLPLLRVCVMGSSFHWTNRDSLLNALEPLIDDEGGIVVISERSSAWGTEEREPWQDVIKQVIQEFLGPERRAAEGTYSHPIDKHQVVLRRSSFRLVEELEFSARQTRTIEQVIGLQLSTSYASIRQLGSRVEEFKQTLAERLREAVPSEVFEKVSNTEVLIATRT